MDSPTPALSRPEFRLPQSHEAFVRANRVIPGGVNSPARAFGAVGGEPPFIARASGAMLHDIDGNSYIDYVGSWGPMILGHAHPAVVSAVAAALELGSSFGAPTIREIEIAELVAGAFPSIEKVRFVSSGTEAAMSAVRLARGVTGRSKIIKMTGHYHGHVDALLVQAGSAATTLGTPNSPGVTEGAVQDTILCPFNDVRAVDECPGTQSPARLPRVLLEPIAGNMGLVPPRAGYLASLRAPHQYRRVLADLRRGDDRLPRGLRRCAGPLRYQAGYDRSRQDHRRRPARRGLWSSGRTHGPNFAGRTDLPGGHSLGQSARHGRRAGHSSFVARRPSVRAARDTFGPAGRGARPRSHRRGYTPRRPAHRKHAHPLLPRRPGPQLRGALQSDTRLFARFFWEMLARGVYLPCSQFEAAFVSAAHTNDDIDRTIEAAREALECARE